MKDTEWRVWYLTWVFSAVVGGVLRLTAALQLFSCLDLKLRQTISCCLPVHIPATWKPRCAVCDFKVHLQLILTLHFSLSLFFFVLQSSVPKTWWRKISSVSTSAVYDKPIFAFHTLFGFQLCFLWVYDACTVKMWVTLGWWSACCQPRTAFNDTLGSTYLAVSTDVTALLHYVLGRRRVSSTWCHNTAEHRDSSHTGSMKSECISNFLCSHFA